MKKMITVTILWLSLLGCKHSNPLTADDRATGQGLHETFAGHFMIGTALSEPQILGADSSARKLVKKEFNAVTPENVMKWELIHPKPESYDFVAADALANYAAENNLFLLGHTLVWHAMTPKWVFEKKDGSAVSREVLLNYMQEHIRTVAGRYQGQVDAWDVVNEALNEDGSLRESPWYTIIGDDYIERAFTLAAQTAPNTALYYNDYNLFEPAKRAGAIKLIKRLQAKGIRVDGIGIQGHYGLDYPDLDEFEQSIIEFAALGIDVVISELDITVLPFPKKENQGADISMKVKLKAELNPYTKGLPAVIERQLGKRYEELFAVLNRHQDKISRVSFWGVCDANTWRNDWPVKGRTDYPLLFDRDMKKKPFASRLAPTM